MEMLVIGVVVIAAFAAVLIPLLRRRPGFGDESEFENIPPSANAAAMARPGKDAAPNAADADADAGSLDSASADPLESEVQRYRAAMRAGTLCRKCGQANPADGIYCYECGERLPLADAKEFE